MELFKALRTLGDKGRVRILRLLQHDDLSVAELQDILGTGQSTISMQLSQLKLAGFVELRRSGQKSIYSAVTPPDAAALLREVLERGAIEIGEAEHDDRALKLVLSRRKDRLKSYFDDVAGKFGRHYVPGESWRALAETFLRLIPPVVIADLGAGDGTLAMLLAQQAERVIAVDSSAKMVEVGAAAAARNGIANLEYLHGDLEELPIGDASVDVAFMHQTLHHALHPSAALAEAWRILRPGGRIVILDLQRHEFEAAKDLYADVWLGFSQVELIDLLTAAGFNGVDAHAVHREEEHPHFETLLAVGMK
ncbi:MAG TPA: metalloregulator ArsR/SmtB family transcription factor [Capsulimonadaceae bacterium]|jgi:ArsR family transcriptional regulator